MSKIEEIKKYSDPYKVAKKIKKDLGIDTHLSTRKDKKYMIKDPNDNWIHFGQMGYEDFTKHNDKERRENFLKRNAKWKNAPIYTPRYLAYHFLW